MIVPIDLLKPILDDLLTIGRPNRPPRPWLGIYATEVGSNVAILGLASRGPAQRADLRAGDIVLSVAGSAVSDLAGLFRRVWALGQAGVEVPLLINREGKTFEVRVRSAIAAASSRAPCCTDAHLWGAQRAKFVSKKLSGCRWCVIRYRRRDHQEHEVDQSRCSGWRAPRRAAGRSRRACAPRASCRRSPSGPRPRARGRPAPAPCACAARRRHRLVHGDAVVEVPRPAVSGVTSGFDSAPPKWLGYSFHGTSAMLRIDGLPLLSCHWFLSHACAASSFAGQPALAERRLLVGRRRQLPGAGRRRTDSASTCTSSRNGLLDLTACSSAPLKSSDFVTVSASTPLALAQPAKSGL